MEGHLIRGFCHTKRMNTVFRGHNCIDDHFFLKCKLRKVPGLKKQKTKTKTLPQSLGILAKKPDISNKVKVAKFSSNIFTPGLATFKFPYLVVPAFFPL